MSVALLACLLRLGKQMDDRPIPLRLKPFTWWDWQRKKAYAIIPPRRQSHVFIPVWRDFFMRFPFSFHDLPPFVRDLQPWAMVCFGGFLVLSDTGKSYSFLSQLEHIKKRLLKEEEGSGSGAAESSDNMMAENSDVEEEEEEEEEEDIGPNAYISLLDQHSELKKKAEGRNLWCLSVPLPVMDFFKYLLFFFFFLLLFWCVCVCVCVCIFLSLFFLRMSGCCSLCVCVCVCVRACYCEYICTNRSMGMTIFIVFRERERERERD